MNQLNYSNFYQVPELKFDITKLRKDLDVILKKKGFSSPKGVSNFGAISLNQIPNDENSIKGNNVRGVYWTIADESGKEISPSDIWDNFQETYLNSFGSYEFIEHHINSSSNKDGTQSDEITIDLKHNSDVVTIEGCGNGPIDAMIDAIKKSFNLEIKISDYHQHAISSGSDAKAVAYSELVLANKSVWGVGMHQNTVIAGLLSVISGLNRLSK